MTQSHPQNAVCTAHHNARQRALRGALRLALRVTFKPVMRRGVPIGFQRAWMRLLSATQLSPLGLSRTRGALGGVTSELTVYRAAAPAAGAILYLHGGAYMTGSAATHRALTGHLAKRTGLPVYALNYRLAPEHKAPAQIDDVVSAWRAMLDTGIDPGAVAFAGDSAGGHLCLTSAFAIAEAGLPMPGALVCLSPVVDMKSPAWHTPPAGDPMLNPSWAALVTELLPGDLALDDPRLSPIFGDLSVLPPLLIQVGEDELLRNDSLRLSDRAREHGVDVTLERFPGYWHVFQLMATALPGADDAIARIARFLAATLRTPQD